MSLTGSDDEGEGGEGDAHGGRIPAKPWVLSRKKWSITMA